MKFCDGVIPEVGLDSDFPMPISAVELDRKTREDMQSNNIGASLFRAMDCVRDINRFLTAAEPWKMKGDEMSDKRMAVVRTTLEAIYIAAHFLAPVIPIAAQKIFDCLNTPPKPSFMLCEFGNLMPGTPVVLGDVLFTKIVDEEESTALKKPPSQKNAGSESKGKTKQDVKSSEVAPDDPDQSDFTKIDLRVGVIRRVWNHESADR